MRGLSLLLGLVLSACANPSREPAAPERAVDRPIDALDARAVDYGEPVADEYPRPAAPTAPVGATPSVQLVTFSPRDPDVRSALESAERGELASAAKRLERAIVRIDRDAALEDRMLAHALLGRRQLALRRAAAARREYDKVLAAWADPEAAAKTITASGADESDGHRRLGQALTALGEARFFEAGQKRAKALALRPPAFAGTPSDEAIRRHVVTAVAAWMKKRRALDDEAERAYREVTDIRPVPPPRWVIASAAEVGTMLEALATDLEQVPVPPGVRRDPALLAAYRAALSDALAPQRERAKAAYRMCQAMAEKFQHRDEHAKTCSDRLAALEAP